MIIRKESYNKSKFFCLHCFKTFKSPGDCCGWPLYRISYKARPPKRNANKNRWRSFFQMFLTGATANKGQLKRIISIRTEYGLSSYQQQVEYNKLVEQHEESFKFLDIKRHEALLSVWVQQKDPYFNEFVEELNGLILYYDENKTSKSFNLNRKYYMVPIHANEGYSTVFSSSLKNYGIFKVTVSYQASTDRYIFRIITNNIDEEYPQYKSTTFFNTKYSLRQGFLIFDTKEQAMAFRYKYLSILVPFLKKEQKPLFILLLKEANADYKRVSRKAPQLLI